MRLPTFVHQDCMVDHLPIILYLNVANTYHCNFHIQYILGHVGIQPNEVIDQLAKSYAASFTRPQQSILLDTDLTALKSALQQNLSKQWINSTPLS